MQSVAALDFARSVTISPDGTSAYVASANSGAVSIFDRNTTTGALTQKPGDGSAVWRGHQSRIDDELGTCGRGAGSAADLRRQTGRNHAPATDGGGMPGP